jgi:hypothetical protein
MRGTRHHCRTRLSLVRRGPTFLQPQGHRNHPFALAPQRALSQKRGTQCIGCMAIGEPHYAVPQTSCPIGASVLTEPLGMLSC